MAYDSNAGTYYVPLTCGVESLPGLNLESNADAFYFYKEPNDYILWGQESAYEHPQTNVGTEYYFYQCGVLSESGIDIESNTGTYYYYSSAFNCVSFCMTDANLPFWDLQLTDGVYEIDPDAGV